MAARYFYEIDGQSYGPVSGAQLKQLAGSGYLEPKHLIWLEGKQKKFPAKTVKGLFDEPRPVDIDLEVIEESEVEVVEEEEVEEFEPEEEPEAEEPKPKKKREEKAPPPNCSPRRP